MFLIFRQIPGYSSEKARASIWEGSMFSFSTYAILAVMVVVLPVAPARINLGDVCV